MPVMIGYQQIAGATNKTEEQVREDRKQGLLDLESLDSIVDYVARARGWVSPQEIDAVVATKVAAAPAAPAAPVVPPKQYAGTSTVKDNVKPTDDPYLARVQRARDGRA